MTVQIVIIALAKQRAGKLGEMTGIAQVKRAHMIMPNELGILLLLKSTKMAMKGRHMITASWPY